MELAQAQREKLKKITTEIKGVSDNTQSIVDETKGLTNNIKVVSENTEGVTQSNQTLLGHMNTRSESSIKQQNQILLNINGLKFELAEQGKRIEEILKKNELNNDIALDNKYAHVSFDSISVIENCEKTPGNMGDFYYELYANGKKLINPAYTLKSPLKLSDNTTSTGKALGQINNIKILGVDDIISLNGYVRERDQKNIFLRWTYKYDGVFTKSIIASQANETISVINYRDCDVKLNVSIRTTDSKI